MVMKAMATGVLAALVGALPAAAQTAPAPTKTLYERIGGYDVIAKITDDFGPKIGKHPTLSRLVSSGRSIDSRMATRQLIVDQVCEMTGGPCIYIGRSMEESHVGLGVTDEDWKAFMVLFAESVNKFVATEPERKELMTLIDGLGPYIIDPKPNMLTAREKEAGWTLLFDGTTTAGWRGYKKADMAGLRWMVKDGCLALPAGDASDTRGNRDIITANQYSNFELAWEWRVDPGGNSGVKYFVTEARDAAIGHEYQHIDDMRHPDARIGPKRQTAAFYDVLAADAATRPAGQFNQSRIVVRGNHVEHWLNGSLALEYELDTDSLRKAIAASKFKDIPDFDKNVKGHILLQDHGDAICYRSIKLREFKSGT